MKRTSILLNEKITAELMDEYNKYSNAIYEKLDYVGDLNRITDDIFKSALNIFKYDRSVLYDKIVLLMLKLSLYDSYERKINRANESMMYKFIEEIDTHTAIQVFTDFSGIKFYTDMLLIFIATKIRLFNLLNKLIFKI